MSSQEEIKELEDKRRRQPFHQSNLQDQQDQDGDAAEILRYLADIQDLPVDEDDTVMRQLISRLVSTANLSPEQVRSHEWVVEYILVLYLSIYPPEYGLHGHERAIVHDDPHADRAPMNTQKRMMLEAFVTNAKLASTRSEGFKAVEETTRNVSESVVHEQDDTGSGRGGLAGMIFG